MVALLALAVFGVYGPVIHGAFLWDDAYLVLGNSLIRSPLLSLEVFRHHLTAESPSVFYRPVQNLSYIFDYWRAGLDAAAYHQTNLLIHALNAVLLFFLAQKWLSRFGHVAPAPARNVSFAVAACWAVHPVHSAIAAYVSGRADSLALCFLLAGWLFWEMAEADAPGRPFRTAASNGAALVAAILAACSKEIAAAGLLLFIMHLWLVRPAIPIRRRIISSLGAAVSLGVYAMLRNLPASSPAATAAPAFPWPERLAMFLRALGDYLRLLIFPDRLFMERQIIPHASLFHHPGETDPLFPWLGWLGGLFLALLLATVLWQGRGRSIRVFGALWFLCTIFPVSNLFSLNASVAEHWLYLPSIGFLLILAGCCTALPASWQKYAPVLAALCLVGLGARTWLRAADWHDGVTFYQATMRDGGDSVRIRINLASEYKKQRKWAGAEQLYREVLARMPDYQWVKYLLAEVLREEGKTAEAGALVQNIPAGTPMQDQAAQLQQLIQSGRLDEALPMARQACAADADSWPLTGSLAEILQKQAHSAAAAQVVGDFAQQHWWHYQSHYLLGELSAKNGNFSVAVAAWRNASRLDIRDVHALNLAAQALVAQGLAAPAVDLQKIAVSRQPDRAQWNYLAALCRLNHDLEGEQAAHQQAEKSRAL